MELRVNLKRLSDAPPRTIKMKCPVCGAKAKATGHVDGYAWSYIHEKDGTHTLKILIKNKENQ